MEAAFGSIADARMKEHSGTISDVKLSLDIRDCDDELAPALDECG